MYSGYLTLMCQANVQFPSSSGGSIPGMETTATTAPGLTDAMRELIDVCRGARWSAEGAVSSLSERVSGSKPGSGNPRLARDLTVSEELERTIRNVAETYRGRAEGVSNGAQTRAVLDEVGMDPTAVAFIYGMTTESVRRLRGRNGRDPDTGEHVSRAGQGQIDGKRLRETPLTAPAAIAQERLEEREADGEVGT